MPQQIGADAGVVHARQLVQQRERRLRLLLQLLLHARVDMRYQPGALLVAFRRRVVEVFEEDVEEARVDLITLDELDYTGVQLPDLTRAEQRLQLVAGALEAHLRALLQHRHRCGELRQLWSVGVLGCLYAHAEVRNEALVEALEPLVNGRVHGARALCVG